MDIISKLFENDIEYSRLQNYKDIKTLLLIAIILFLLSCWTNWIYCYAYGFMRSSTEQFYGSFFLGSAIFLYVLSIKFKWFIRIPIVLWILVAGYHWVIYADHFFYSQYVVGNVINGYAILKARHDVGKLKDLNFIQKYPLDFLLLLIGTLILIYFYKMPMY